MINPVYALHCGDVREVLRSLPANSVHTVVTSPPYYNMRKYEIPDSVWGGDPDHNHEWEALRQVKRGHPGLRTWDSKATRGLHSKGATARGQACECGAWLGTLGLEPTPELYVDHIVDVFEEVWRVLRKDGILWLNLNDSYAGSGKGWGKKGMQASSRAWKFPPDTIWERPPNYISSLGPLHGVGDGIGNKAQQDSTSYGWTYRGLCDGCAALLQRRNPDTGESHGPRLAALTLGSNPAHRESCSPHAESSHSTSQVDRSADVASGLVLSPDHVAGQPPDVQASTTPVFSPQPLDECLHCDSCGVCRAVLYSYAPYALGCGRTGGRLNKDDKGDPVWGTRKVYKDASGWAYPYCTIPSLKPKDLMMMPFEVAKALRTAGWWLRSIPIWHKPNVMPESVSDRPTNDYEFIFMLTKGQRPFYDAEAVKVPQSEGTHQRFGKNTHVRSAKRKLAAANEGVKNNESYDAAMTEMIQPDGKRHLRTVWRIPVKGYPDAHFATFPEELPEIPIAASTSEHGVCGACGSPWERLVDKTASPHDGTTASAYTEGTAANRLALARQAAREHGKEYKQQTRTIGWSPTCECTDAELVQATVLDPFCGSGTTGVVALRLGRNFIGIDAGEEYAEMARERIVNDAPLLNRSEG